MVKMEVFRSSTPCRYQVLLRTARIQNQNYVVSAGTGMYTKHICRCIYSYQNIYHYNEVVVVQHAEM